MRPPYIVQFSTTGSKPTALLRVGQRDCLQQHAHICCEPARITCPTCLDSFLLPENGIDGLPVNIYLDPIRRAKELAAFNANLYKAEMKTGYSHDNCHNDTHSYSKLESKQNSPLDLTDLETLVQSCRAKLQERHLVMKKLNQHGIEMKHNMLEIKQQVKDFVQQIISDLNHEELRLMKDIESRYSKNDSALSKAKASIERTNDFLQEACNNAEKLCGDCPNANTIRLSQMELSDLLVELSKPFNIEEFHFLPITQNITAKGLGSIVSSPKKIPTDELKAIHYSGFLTDDTTVKKAQATVTKNSNDSSSKVLVTKVCNPDVKSNHASGKEKKILDQNSKTSDETTPHKTSDETIPRKTADGTIPHKTRKTADETIPHKTSDETIPRKTADETIPHKTSDETIPRKTADETIPHKTSDETIPRKTADETIPHKTTAVSRELKVIAAHPGRHDANIPRHINVSKNPSSRAISQEKRNNPLKKANPRETTVLKAAGHDQKDGTKIPRPTHVPNSSKDNRVEEKSDFLSPIKLTEIELTLRGPSNSSRRLAYPRPVPQIFNSPSMPASKESNVKSNHQKATRQKGNSNSSSSSTSAHRDKTDDCKGNNDKSNHQKATRQKGKKHSPSTTMPSSTSEDKGKTDDCKGSNVKSNFLKAFLQRGNKYIPPTTAPSSTSRKVDKDKTDDCKGNNVKSNHQKGILQQGTRHRPSTPMPSSISRQAVMDKTGDYKGNNVKSNYQKAGLQKSKNHSPLISALSSTSADKDKKDTPLSQKGSGTCHPNVEWSQATKSRGKAKGNMPFSKSDTAIPTETSGNCDSKKDDKPTQAAHQRTKGKLFFKCFSQKAKKTKDKNESPRHSDHARILAKCNQRHMTEGSPNKIEVKPSPYETAYPTVRSSITTKNGQAHPNNTDAKHQQQHRSLLLSQQHREVINAYTASVRPSSRSKGWPRATRHQRSVQRNVMTQQNSHPNFLTKNLHQYVND
ncbi:uncharacterized protein LOC144878667 isoform X2 [Branchiostoma floridae x Branchiostoma japonicum]